MPGLSLRVKPVGERVAGASPGVFDEPLLNDYLDFVAARSRPNSVLAVMYDLKVFFAVVDRPVAVVTARDVFAFVTAQRAGLPRISDPGSLQPAPPVVDGAGVSLRTVQRRLSTISGLYAFLAARGDVPMVRPPRTLPTIVTPGQVDGLLSALRTHRDRAMIAAMLLGGLRRCEVLGLRLEDLRPHRPRSLRPCRSESVVVSLLLPADRAAASASITEGVRVTCLVGGLVGCPVLGRDRVVSAQVG